ncbi:hypothetical protein [Rhodococcus chondri]|uniref:Acetyltransferase n=1 Tax=Rhodococcus chondri TaxID=3065941 RepID=A0ABU7JPC1_9NOCA|nr:hypothetical protein [Rhodococcus sp. CC-R104]MEE2031875.1 hypothetical protein [Rhodococcus sp. CC-R104]
MQTTADTARDTISTYRDPVSKYTFVTAPPHAVPDIWREYLDGALAAYTRYGAESALEYDKVRAGHSTALFSAALDDNGVVVGGLRAQGPFRSSAESHAPREWENPENITRIREMIEARIPFGLIEAKAAWVGEDVPGRRDLTLAVARMGAHFMHVLGTRFMMATAADTVLDLWRTCGGVVDESIPHTPYPDARYRTRLMWWDSTRIDRFGFPVGAPPGSARSPEPETTRSEAE